MTDDLKARARDWWERVFPPRDHPLWPILKTAVTICGLWVFLAHGSTHLEDSAGVVAGGAGMSLLKDIVGALFKKES